MESKASLGQTKVKHLIGKINMRDYTPDPSDVARVLGTEDELKAQAEAWLRQGDHKHHAINSAR